MSIPYTESIGKARWRQVSDEETTLELRIPITLPDGVRPRDLQVEIKDTTVLIISHGHTRMIQWRLHAPVSSEVEWSVQGDTMVLELEKTSAATWACLLDLPMRADDELLVSIDEINKMFAAQLPSLPPVGTENSKADEDEKKEDEEAEGDEQDLDKLLEEAAEEVVVCKDADNGTDEGGFSAYLKAELENFKSESEHIVEKMNEVNQEMADPSNEDAREKLKLLEEILRLHNACRELRSQPVSLQNFLMATQLEIQKARANIGQLSEEETEEFESEEEKKLTPTELMTCGLKFYQDEDLKGCIHFLRLAALHHKHDQSIMLLYSIYSQLGTPRGAFILLRRALDENEQSAVVLHKVGELFDEGARNFLPIFPAALYFYQLAAKLGSPNAMLSLAQLWLRGSTATHMLSAEQAEAQKSIAKYHAWLQKAMDRGCGSAYFVRGCMHLKGEHGMEKSYQLAKEYLDAASNAQPEILRRAPQIVKMLEDLHQEESGSGSTPATTAATRPSAKPSDAEDSTMKVTPSASRLSALGGAGGSGFGSGAGQPHRAKKAFGPSTRRKVFWERACVSSLVAYGVYTLAFPIRIIMLPYFYTLVSNIVDVIPWLGNSNAADIVF